MRVGDGDGRGAAVGDRAGDGVGDGASTGGRGCAVSVTTASGRAAGEVAAGLVRDATTVLLGADVEELAPHAVRPASRGSSTRGRFTGTAWHAGPDTPPYGGAVRLLPALLTVALLAACGGGGDKPPADPGITGLHTFTGLSHTHTTAPVDYPQSPPVGGPHSPAWLKCGVYGTELPETNAVHSEEHGGVWLTYAASLPAAGIVALADLAHTNVEFVLVSPYAAQASPVVASTWGAQITSDSAGDPRLLAFIKRYAGGDQGGEKGVGCRTSGLTLAKVLEFDKQK